MGSQDDSDWRLREYILNRFALCFRRVTLSSTWSPPFLRIEPEELLFKKSASIQVHTIGTPNPILDV